MVWSVFAVFRGFLARRRVGALRMAQDERFTRAAINLQRYFRMWHAQALYTKMQLERFHVDAERATFARQACCFGLFHRPTPFPVQESKTIIGQLPYTYRG